MKRLLKMMNNEPAVSLIVTTYNWPMALGFTLESALRQSRPPDEVIIADDGSGPETANIVEEVLGPSNLKWRHVWHADKGVRQSRIKNLAVKYSQGPYLILVDQDVVLHQDFIADHLSMAGENIFLQGKRSLLPEYYTKRIFSNGVFKTPGPWLSGLGNRKNRLRLPVLGRLLARSKGYETSLRGCNLSMFKEDFLRVDGFDEVFDRSWGREDSDICYRLFHCGIRVRNLWFLALQYHLHHALVKNWDRERLDKELERNIQERRIKALEGFSQLSPEGEIIAASG